MGRFVRYFFVSLVVSSPALSQDGLDTLRADRVQSLLESIAVTPLSQSLDMTTVSELSHVFYYSLIFHFQEGVHGYSLFDSAMVRIALEARRTPLVFQELLAIQRSSQSAAEFQEGIPCYFQLAAKASPKNFVTAYAAMSSEDRLGLVSKSGPGDCEANIDVPRLLQAFADSTKNNKLKIEALSAISMFSTGGK